MTIFLSPHNDDESLFGAFTLMREKPLVVLVTDSYVEFNRGDGVTWRQRRGETEQAMKLLGCPVFFAGLRDDDLKENDIREVLDSFRGITRVYAPKPYDDGHPQHNSVGKVAVEAYGSKLVTFYSTYKIGKHYVKGRLEVKPTEEELELKRQALQCYQSQLSLPSTRPHFEAVLGKSEWYA